MLGVSGSLIAMIYIRGLPSDYDGWERRGCSGLSWADVFPVFKHCENNINFTADP